MPRKSPWPPHIKRHASGQAYIYIRGKYHYLGIYGSKEAAENYQAFVNMEELAGNNKRVCDGPTVATVCDKFLADSLSGFERGEKSTACYMEIIRILLELHGRKSAATFSAKDLESIGLELAKRNYALVSINRYMGRIRTIWRWAEKEELVPPGRWNHLRTARGLRASDPRVRVTPDRAPTSFEDMEKVRKHCVKVVGDMLAVQWWTGMRSVEVRLMRWEEIDTSGDVWVYTVGPDANKMAHRGQPRRVMIGKESQAILGQKNSIGHVFPTPEGEAYTKNGYCQAVRRASKRAGVKVIPYGGRHAAKMRYARELGAEAARAVLGHKSIRTQEHYGVLDTELAKDAARRFG